jgi:8-oxo-dGTP pyrophosphatase MutT (NUDIX family)
MNFDPQKFFIGLMDFFSILLPGALLTWLMMGEVGPVVLGDRYANLNGAQAWAAFLFASYLIGHLVFLLGSWLDELYDWARRYTLNTQIALLARRGRLLPWLARALVWLVFKRERNLAVDCATRIKQQALGSLQAKDAVNTFQWSKAWLNAESPTSLAVVQRFEADSKFFRCFAVVMLILLVAWPWQHQWPPAGIPIVLTLLLLALWRYMEQRYKATNQAYWAVITLASKEGNVASDKVAKEARNASGVVFCLRGGTAEYLLVEATNDPTQWVLPKGHVEEGEQPRETAVREVHEETGVWARVDHDLGAATWSVDGAVVTTRFFLMRAAGRGLRKDKDREHVWLPLQEAIAKASHVETRELLQAAEQRRSRSVGTAPALATSTTST